MMSNTATATIEIKKLHLEAMVYIAIDNIPQVDPTTLKRFLELVQAEGTFGTISHEQILRGMYAVMKQTPDASIHSLIILLDLLEIKPANRLALSTLRSNRLDPTNAVAGEPILC
jgi:hypothetical protein